MKPKAFLICPVRKAEPNPEVDALVKELEEKYDLHWPPRDTDQEQCSLDVCFDNLSAIDQASIVFCYWGGESEGRIFDLGMSFALQKRIVPISLPALAPGKSFPRFAAELDEVQAQMEEDEDCQQDRFI